MEKHRFIKVFLAAAPHLLHPEHNPQTVYIGLAPDDFKRLGAGEIDHVPEPPPKPVVPTSQMTPQELQIAALQAQLAALTAAKHEAPPPAPVPEADLSAQFAAFETRIAEQVARAVAAATKPAAT